MDRRARTLSFTALALVVALSGCAIPRNGVPLLANSQVSAVMTSAGPLEIREQYYPGQGVIRHALGPTSGTHRAPPRRKDGTVGYDLLALSGGGSNGAFGAGVLCGWTKAGTRPDFQVVTGISAGSLLSSFAFAGPEFDDRMHALFTTMSNDQVYRRNSLLRLFWSDSLARTDPLAQLIAFQVDSSLLAAVAKGDGEGRRLYVGTTDLDHKRLVIWDMGSIAASGHPGAAELYGRILLASSSIPVVFNPVELQVQSDGQVHSELHVDGGTRSQVFLRSILVRNLDPAAHAGADRTVPADPLTEGGTPVAGPGKAAPARPINLEGSRLYVIMNGKLQADSSPARRDLLPIAEESLNAMMYAKSSGDLFRLYSLANTTGMTFHLLAIPQNTPNVPPPAKFDPKRMSAVFRVGHDLARSGNPWMSAPHGLDESDLPGYERDALLDTPRVVRGDDSFRLDDADAELEPDRDEPEVTETPSRRARR